MPCRYLLPAVCSDEPKGKTMPCRDDFRDTKPPRPKKKPVQPTVAEAVLCGLLSNFASAGSIKTVLNSIDWNETGVTKAQALDWWTKHKAQDDQRKLKQAALAKLTPAERKALGL
jgi:hypothetical protein